VRKLGLKPRSVACLFTFRCSPGSLTLETTDRQQIMTRKLAWFFLQSRLDFLICDNPCPWETLLLLTISSSFTAPRLSWGMKSSLSTCWASLWLMDFTSYRFVDESSKRVCDYNVFVLCPLKRDTRKDHCELIVQHYFIPARSSRRRQTAEVILVFIHKSCDDSCRCTPISYAIYSLGRWSATYPS